MSMSDEEEQPNLVLPFDFQLDQPEISKQIVDLALSAGGYPYKKYMKTKPYERQLRSLQIELLKLQHWVRTSGKRVIIIFEGRDSAGKGGTIARLTQHLNPRHAKVVALTKPTEVEQGQWYFQRYIDHFPTAGKMTIFDRSWYNRAGVERVMGFCTGEQYDAFMAEVPNFESMLVRDGFLFFKFWLSIGQETQLYRFHKRRHDPLKHWKLSPIDIAALGKWDDYTKARKAVFELTDKEKTPWTVVKANDKKRARLAVIQYLLWSVDYDGKDYEVVGTPDKNIIGDAHKLLHSNE